MSRAWRPASVLTCTPRPPALHPSICLWLTSCLPSFILNTCLCLGLRPRPFLPRPANRPVVSVSNSSPDDTKRRRLSPQTSNYTKFIKIHQTDVAKDPWQAAGSRQSGEEEPWRLKEGGSAGVRLWDCVSEGNRDLSGAPNKAGRPTGWKNKRLPKWICFQREFGNKKVAFKYLLSQL